MLMNINFVGMIPLRGNRDMFALVQQFRGSCLLLFVLNDFELRLFAEREMLGVRGRRRACRGAALLFLLVFLDGESAAAVLVMVDRGHHAVVVLFALFLRALARLSGPRADQQTH